MSKKFLKFRDVKPIPAIINAEVGAIINSLRSSLDLLASAIAKRHMVLGQIDAYFPIAESFDDWMSGNYKANKFVKSLPADDAQVFEALKPYPGGNDSLYALHHLDILRKHRRLVGVGLVPVAVLTTPDLIAAGFMMPRVWPRFEDGAVIAWFDIDATEGQLEAPVNVTFEERALLPGRPVMAALSDFAGLANSIIELFE